jgi:hypothetical protein
MSYLSAHLDGMRAWQELAREIIVVDSFSSDGSVDFIKSRLAHPNVRFLSHPPGLYQSWNHAISQITQPFFYLATTGDTITRAGIETLVAAAESLAADVVISKPEFWTRDGRPAEDIRWPIDDIIATLGVTAPRKLTKLEAVIFAVTHATGAMLGSSASNLYRTGVFQRLPFPVDFGTSGDGAWGLLHAAEVVWGVVPGKFSTFLIHPTNASADEKRSWLEARRADEVLRAGMESWRRAGVINDAELTSAGWNDLMSALSSFLDAKSAFDQCRRGSFPWILNPGAWQNRARRGRAARQLQQYQRQALARCSEQQVCASC